MSRSCRRHLTGVCRGPEEYASSGSGPDSEVADCTHTFKGRPGGTKAVRDEVSRSKIREGGLYAQVAATDKMAEAQMLKAVGLVEQNLLLLMTTGDSALVNAEAREYMELRRVQELRKLKLRMAAKEAAEVELEGNRTRKRAVGAQGSEDFGEPSPEAELGAEGPEECAADLLQEQGYRSGLWAGGYGNLGQNAGVYHHDFSSQIGAQNWEWDDVVQVDSQQPTTWATWNSHSQEMSQTVDLSDTSLNVGLSLHG